MAEYKIALDGGPPWGIRLHNQPVSVSAVNPGSKAHRQGIETGDQVLSINDETVQDIEQAQQLVRNASNSLVLQLRRAPREASFSRPSRPTFLCDSRQAAAHATPSTDSNLDQEQSQQPPTSNDNFSSTQLPPTTNSVEKISNSTQKNSSAVFQKSGESVTGNNSSENLSEISTLSPSKMIENNDTTGNETRTAISGPPMSPSFKVRGGVTPQIWSPTQTRSAAVKEFYPNNLNHQDQNYPSVVPPSSHCVPPSSHSSLSTASTADDRSGQYNITSTHNGVYSPSSSSSGIMSATNSERTDDATLAKDYDDRHTGIMYRGGKQEPHSVMFVDRTNADFSKLPRSQNPTVTLLQKAREGNLQNKTPSYATQNSNQQEFYHTSSVPSSRGNNEVIRHTFAAPPKYEDVGPMNEKGMPTALRSVVKEDKQHDWYKKMFKAIHRPEDETDFVLVKYQNPRKGARYSPTPKNQYLSDAYMSEPELGREDNYPHYSTTSDVETSRDYNDFARTHSLPRTKKDTTLDEPRRQSATVVNENPYKYRTSPPKIQSDSLQFRSTTAPKVEPKSWMPAGTQRYQPEPRKLDDYQPGRSSISIHEALQDRDWRRQNDLYNPPPENPVPQYSISSVASGGIKPDSTIYRRTLTTRAMSPEEQRDIYKEVQKGGDVPLTGLRMSTPQKPKDMDYGSLFGADAQRMELDIDKIAAPPAKKPLTDTGSRTLSARDYNSSYYSTPVRSTTGTLERKSSRTNDYDDIEFDLQKEYKKIDEIYEREREKRQKSQLRDDEKRRHNYVPTQTKSPVPGDRYDSVYDDPFNFRPGRPRSVSPGILGFGRRDRARSTSSQGGDFLDNELIGPARALYNFTAQNPRELSFRQGDIVQVLRLLDENWIEGECNNRSGIAPASYLESMNADRRKRMEKLAQEGQARAKYDFSAQSQVEMSLKKGEMIVLIRRVDRNWYEGKIGARRGILPVAYVEVLKQPGTDASNSNIQPRQTSPSPARPMDPPAAKSPGPVRRKSSTVLEGSDRETFGDTVLKEFKTQVSQSPEGPSSGLRRNSAKSSIDELLIPPPPTTSVQEELDLLRRAPERCRVLYNYRKQHEDELELREGEIIDVTERCDDGWFNGKNKRGDQGYFPGNYVQSL